MRGDSDWEAAEVPLADKGHDGEGNPMIWITVMVVVGALLAVGLSVYAAWACWARKRFCRSCFGPSRDMGDVDGVKMNEFHGLQTLGRLYSVSVAPLLIHTDADCGRTASLTAETTDGRKSTHLEVDDCSGSSPPSRSSSHNVGMSQVQDSISEMSKDKDERVDKLASLRTATDYLKGLGSRNSSVRQPHNEDAQRPSVELVSDASFILWRITVLSCHQNRSLTSHPTRKPMWRDFRHLDLVQLQLHQKIMDNYQKGLRPIKDHRSTRQRSNLSRGFSDGHLDDGAPRLPAKLGHPFKSVNDVLGKVAANETRYSCELPTDYDDLPPEQRPVFPPKAPPHKLADLHRSDEVPIPTCVQFQQFSNAPTDSSSKPEPTLDCNVDEYDVPTSRSVIEAVPEFQDYDEPTHQRARTSLNLVVTRRPKLTVTVNV